MDIAAIADVRLDGYESGLQDALELLKGAFVVRNDTVGAAYPLEGLERDR